MKNMLALATLALIGGAVAAPRISAQSIIVNPIPSDLAVRVSTDKDPSGQQLPTYTIGERIRLSVSTNQDAYVYLFNLSPDGTIDQILPNRYASGGNFVKAGIVKTFPAANDTFQYNVGGPAGLNKVLALASKTPLNLDQISSFQADATGNSGFATVTVKGQQNLAQALSITVNAVPQNSWVSDTAFFNAVSQTPVRTGSLTVVTNAENATVYLNDRAVGQSGTTFSNLAPGNYRVRISAPGYADYTSTVRIAANATVNLNITLQPTRANLTVRSNVDGATVFVNGRSQGTIQGGALTLSLSRDNYEIVVIAPGYRANVSEVQVVNGGGITLNLTRLQ